MNNRRWLGLILVVLAGASFGISHLHAQDRMGPKRGNRVDLEPERPSHLPLNDDLAGNLNPQELMANRLMQSRFRKQGLADPAEMSRLTDLAKRLFDDPTFRESVGKGISPKTIENFHQQLRGNQGDVDVEGLKKLLDQLKGSQSLTSDQQELIKQFNGIKERVEAGKAAPRTAPPDLPPPSTPPPSPSGSSNPGIGQSRNPAPNELSERSEEMFRNLSRRMVDPKWVDSVMGQNWQKTLQDMSTRASQARGQTSRFTDRARSLGRFMPRFTNLMPKGLFGRSPQPRFPSLPRFGSMPNTPSIGGTSGGSVSGVGKGILAILSIGVLGFLLWQARGWWEKNRIKNAKEWRLGPWPVLPGEVSTRRDLVRAFEYLSLLRLGIAARTCHHLELAERIGDQPALDRDRRREAASTLAQLYEQARYTPDDETLSPETLARARRELGYLAGAPA